MKKTADLPCRPETSRFVKVRRIISASAIVAIASALSACASGSSAVSEASDTAWTGAKPRPMATTSSYSATPRIGSQPLLPPVPEENANLAPIKISAIE